MLFGLSCLSCVIYAFRVIMCHVIYLMEHTALCSFVKVVLVWFIGCQMLNTICVGNEICLSLNLPTNELDSDVG